jgi:integrase
MGETKARVYHQVPVPRELTNFLDLLYDLRNLKKNNDPFLSLPLWSQKTILNGLCHDLRDGGLLNEMDNAGIEGTQATPKSFRYGFGVAMVMGGMDIYTLQHIMGHERPETTAIYLQVKGLEAHDVPMQYWNRANKKWKE